MTPRGYSTIAKIEDYLLIDIIDSFEGRVNEWIAQMEEFVEQETGRAFMADETASEKVYDGNGGLDLFLEECVEITKVTIDDVEVDSDDYLVYPASELPTTRIKLKNDAGLAFTKDEQNIKIEAKWGYSVLCPGDISFAVTVLVAGIINCAGEMEGEIKSEKIGSYNVTYKDKTSWQNFQTVKEILKRYSLITV